MYGKLDEITGLDFIRVQLDTAYRKKWDPSAVELMVVEEDGESINDIVYWEVQWPVIIKRKDDCDCDEMIVASRNHIFLLSAC